MNFLFLIRKMVIPWSNYQRNLTEQYSCIKSQTQALKSQLNWKQQQYKSLLMKGPKTKEKLRETRRQIEQLLQLVCKSKEKNFIYSIYFLQTSLQNLVQTPISSNNFQQIALNYIQMERNYLSVLQNVWLDDNTYEQNPSIDLIKQLNQRTVKYID